jgi:two-component system sensor histidine kinase/response regulator
VAEDPDLDDSALARLDRLGGSKLSGKMIDLFLLHATDRIEAATRAQATGSQTGVLSAMHSLKSSAGNVGARMVQDIAESIEQESVTRDLEWVGQRLADLREANRRVAALLRQRRETLGT